MVETENFESLGAHPFMQFGSHFLIAVTPCLVNCVRELDNTLCRADSQQIVGVVTKNRAVSADSTRACLSAALLWLEWKSVFTLSYLLG